MQINKKYNHWFPTETTEFLIKNSRQRGGDSDGRERRWHEGDNESSREMKVLIIVSGESQKNVLLSRQKLKVCSSLVHRKIHKKFEKKLKVFPISLNDDTLEFPFTLKCTKTLDEGAKLF